MGSADGSLTITDVRVSDDGIYTLQLISLDGTSGHYAMLLVSSLVRAFLSVAVGVGMLSGGNAYWQL